LMSSFSLYFRSPIVPPQGGRTPEEFL